MSYAEATYTFTPFKGRMIWYLNEIKTMNGEKLDGFKIVTEKDGETYKSIEGNVTIKKMDDKWWSLTDHTDNFYMDLYC